MMLWDKATKEPPPRKLELFSYENNPVRAYLHSDDLVSKFAHHPYNFILYVIMFSLSFSYILKLS